MYEELLAIVGDDPEMNELFELMCDYVKDYLWAERLEEKAYDKWCDAFDELMEAADASYRPTGVWREMYDMFAARE